MNLKLLKAYEREFLARYPGGFMNEEMQEIGKKHRVDKMEAMVHECFASEKFVFPGQIVEDMIKVVTRSSLVSVFEKPKFRDYVRSLDESAKEQLASGLYELLHGDKEMGFNRMLEVLVAGKMAKWSLMTVIPVYYALNEEIFVKPTVTKNVIRIFELEDVVYKPRPSYEFYKKYKAHIMTMKEACDPLVKPNNPAFTGFLMITME